MEYLDFIILKVNGTDVSGFPHADAVRQFLAAEEPIVVEVMRKVTKVTPVSSCSSSSSTYNDAKDPPAAIYTNTALLRQNIHTPKPLPGSTDGDVPRQEPDGHNDECQFSLAEISEVPEDKVLYQNDCMARCECRGCAKYESDDSVTEESSRLVSRSVQTHLTALNWIDELEECLLHIDLEELMAQKCSSSSGSTSEGFIGQSYHNALVECSTQSIEAPSGFNTSEDIHNSYKLEDVHELEDGVGSEDGDEDPARVSEDMENVLAKSPTNSFIRTQLESINEQIALLDHRMNRIQIVSKPPKLMCPESDVEHIYETIQDTGDSEAEPIYSSPYEPETEAAAAASKTDARVRTTEKKRRSKSMSVGSGGGGGDADTSSAYHTGTGGSSNNNQVPHFPQKPPPLTLKLGCNHTNRSVLQLCAPHGDDWTQHSGTERLRKSAHVSRTRHKSTPRDAPAKDNNGAAGGKQTQGPPLHLPADTMYTNMANLHQTILLQQQLFRQALHRRQTPFREAVRSSSSSTFPGDNQVSGGTERPSDQCTKMEWKVKRRQNGTRYIARRPIRNRILRNRTKEIIEQRGADLTTEDDACSEIKLGRYWSKEERKKQIMDRERKSRQQQDAGGDGHCKPCSKAHRLTEPTTPEGCSHSKWPRPPPGKMPSPLSATPVPPKKPSDRKTIRKKSQKDAAAGVTDDFKTVQEMLVNGSRASNSSTGKMIGLLSVTTV